MPGTPLGKKKSKKDAEFKMPDFNENINITIEDQVVEDQNIKDNDWNVD